MSELPSYSALPKAAREALWEQFERHMRAMFDEIGADVLDSFLRQDGVAEQWADYREACFQQEMGSPDTEYHFEEWLTERGLAG